MLTSKLHLILAAINFIGAGASYLIWRKKDTRKPVISHFVLFFTLFIFYHLLLSLPFLASGGNMEAMAWGYNLAVLFLFLLVSPMYSVMAYQVLNIKIGNIKLLTLVFFLIGMVVFAVQTYDFRLPIIESHGLVIWNNNFVAGFVTLFFASMAAIFWVAIYFHNRPEKMDRREKLKAFLFTAGTLALAVASLYFIARNPVLVAISFIFVFLGTVLVNAVILIREKEQTGN